MLAYPFDSRDSFDFLTCRLLFGVAVNPNWRSLLSSFWVPLPFPDEWWVVGIVLVLISFSGIGMTILEEQFQRSWQEQRL